MEYRAPLLVLCLLPAILILLAPSLGLMIYANTFTVLHAEKLALWALPIVLAFFALLFRQAKQGVAPVGSILGVLFFACCYGFGSVRAVDHLPTHAPAQFYSAAIVDKHETSGRSSSYYLHLAPWGPFQDENKLEVNHSLYEAAEIGDKICLELHQGLLHAPWYVPASCSKIPAQEQ